MSDYYDLFLTVELPEDLPEPAMRELRWLLGEAEAPTPLTSADWETWGYPWQVFDGGIPSHAFDGVDSSSLLRTDRTYADGSTPWALTVRTCVHEDEFGMVMEVVAWVLALASSRGGSASCGIRARTGFSTSCAMRTASTWSTSARRGGRTA